MRLRDMRRRVMTPLDYAGGRPDGDDRGRAGCAAWWRVPARDSPSPSSTSGRERRGARRATSPITAASSVVRARNCRIPRRLNKRDAGAGVGAGSAPLLLLPRAARGCSPPPRAARRAPPAPPRGSFGGGRVGRRDNDLIGTTVQGFRRGVQGIQGKIVDATETTVRAELQAQARTVTVQRSQLVGAAPSAPSVPAGAYNPRTPPRVDTATPRARPCTSTRARRRTAPGR